MAGSEYDRGLGCSRVVCGRAGRSVDVCSGVVGGVGEGGAGCGWVKWEGEVAGCERVRGW